MKTDQEKIDLAERLIEMCWVERCNTVETIEVIANALAAVVKQAVEKEIAQYHVLKKQIDMIIERAEEDWN